MDNAKTIAAAIVLAAIVLAASRVWVAWAEAEPANVVKPVPQAGVEARDCLDQLLDTRDADDWVAGGRMPSRVPRGVRREIWAARIAVAGETCETALAVRRAWLRNTVKEEDPIVLIFMYPPVPEKARVRKAAGGEKATRSERTE